MTDKAKIEPLRRAHPCPECSKASTRESYPFCSERCRQHDLSRWLTGAYAIPVANDESKADDEQSDPYGRDGAGF